MRSESPEQRTRAAPRQAAEPSRQRALGYLNTGVGAHNYVPELQHQAQQIELVCGRRGWTLLEHIREMRFTHAGTLGRPALEYALRRLESGEASRLVVARLESLCHSIADLGIIVGQLHQRGARLLCIEPEIDTESEAGWTVMRSLIAVSGWERERLSQRTRKGLVTARHNRAMSRPAVEDRPELQRRILAMRERGMTLQAIADALNADGVPTLRGGTRWRPSSLDATLRQRPDGNHPF